MASSTTRGNSTSGRVVRTFEGRLFANGLLTVGSAGVAVSEDAVESTRVTECSESAAESRRSIGTRFGMSICVGLARCIST